MDLKQTLDIVQGAGVLGASMLALWALLTGKVVTRREFDALQGRYDAIDQLNTDANTELRKQSATNAKLVEMTFQQLNEAQDIRRQPRRGAAND